MKAYVKCLTPFRDLIQAASADDFPTLSVVPYQLWLLDKKLREIRDTAAGKDDRKSRTVLELATSLIDSVDERYSFIFKEVSLPLLAAAMDPFYGGQLEHFGVPRSVVDAVWDKLHDQAVNVVWVPSENVDESMPSEQEIKLRLSSIRGLFEREGFVERLTANNKTALQWWKENRERNWVIVDLACMLLGIPATSTFSERVFSSSGAIMPRSRGAMHLETMIDLTVIRGVLRQATPEERRKWVRNALTFKLWDSV
jgi:hypothetical protein